MPTKTQFIIAVPTLIALGCGLNGEGKDSCDKPSDCLDGFVCTAEGTCLEGPGTYGEFLQGFADAYCARIESCCGALPAEFPSRDWCVTSIVDQLPPEAANAELEGDMITTANDCLQEIEDLACAEANDTRLLFEMMLSPSAEAACLDLLPASSPVCNGESCDGDCIDEVCYSPVSTGQSCCVEAQAGTVCSTQLCAEGDYCDIDGDSLCHAKLSVGQSCVQDGHCASLFCNTSTNKCASASLDSVICSDAVTETITVSGAVEGETPEFADARFEPDDSCGATGIYIATSGQSLAGCSAPLSLHLTKPYIQITLSDSTPGTYENSDEGSCASGGKKFSATFDGETTGTDDSLSGTVTITSSDAGTVAGSYEIEFREGSDGPSAGTLTGTFSVGTCE